MEWPIVAPAPVVIEHAAVFRDLFDNHCQFRHFQHDLTGLIVLPNKSLAHRARGILDSADTTHWSRLLSEAPWRADELHCRRIRFLLHQTMPQRQHRRKSLVVIDDTLCEQVGSLLDHVDRHDHHSAGTYPWAHHPVTSFSVSGPGRFPLGLRLYRRYEELTQWEAAVATHFPELKIPPDKKTRNRLHQQVDPVWLQDPEFRARHAQFRPKIALAIDLVEEASGRKVPVGVVVFDAWSLAEDVVQVLARRRQAWISLLKKNRLLETASFHWRDPQGWTLKLPGPHIAVEELVPWVPAHAYRPINVREDTSWCFTRTVRIPGGGKVRMVVSCEHESLTGRSVVLVTNRVDWSAAKIIHLSGQRWSTETFDQDSQGPLGFSAYRMRSAKAMGKHGGLVFGASARLPLTCLPAGPGRTWGLIHTMGDACRQQGRTWLQRLLRFVHDPLSQGAPIDQVLAQVLAKQRGSVPL